MPVRARTCARLHGSGVVCTGAPDRDRRYSMTPRAAFALVLPALLARLHLQNPAPAPHHPNAIAELVVPAGTDVRLLADSITFDQATGDTSLTGSVVIRLSGGVELRPREVNVFVHGGGPKEETRIYIEA